MLRIIEILAWSLILSNIVTASPIPTSQLDQLFDFTNTTIGTLENLESSVSKSVSGVYKLNFDIKRGSNLKDASSSNVAKVVTDSSEVQLTNENTFYLASVKIGTPYQEVGLTIDTGSADLWVQGTSNPYCEEIGCEQWGTYNSSESSTYKALTNLSKFQITYGDNTYATGVWSTENIGFGELQVSDVQFGLAQKSTSEMGVFGIGLKATESAEVEYDNFPVQLVNQGVISKNAYSIYLSSADADYGSILFGGIDHAKYSGTLTTIPLSKDSSDSYSSLSIVLDSVLYESNSYSVNSNALIDSGTTLTYLPSSVVSSIASDLGAQYNWSAGAFLIECNSTASISFQFAGVQIEVPVSQLTLPLSTISNADIEGACALGIFASSDIILGDNFIRNCYSVFDLDDKTISLAQINYTDEEDVQPIS